MFFLFPLVVKNEYKGFCATVLRENRAMIHVFKKRYPKAKLSDSPGSEVRIQMEFDEVQEKTAQFDHDTP